MNRLFFRTGRLASLIILSLFLVVLFKTETSKAVPSFEYPEYNVTIDIQEDSSYIVTEEIVNIIDGDGFHGLRRDIPLENKECIFNLNRVCGGFESIVPLGLWDDSKKSPDNGTTRYYFVDDGIVNSARFEWEIDSSEEGRSMNNEKITWYVQYQIYGGLQFLDNMTIFYWNTLPNDRAGYIDKAKIVIKFPDNIDLNQNKLTIFSPYEYQLDTDFKSNAFEFRLKNLSNFGDQNFTAAYEFSSKDFKYPGDMSPQPLTYKIKSPYFTNSIYINDLEVSTAAEDTFLIFPRGTFELEFRHFGYESLKEKLEIKTGDNFIEVELTPKPWMQAIIFLNYFLVVVGVAAIPYLMFKAYRKYLTSGRDLNKTKTIIPLYRPPKDVKPYLLGSLKDEKVDQRDITGSIIDLAYRGYIKIKEIKKGKDYELTKLKDFENSTELFQPEKDLLKALFDGKDKMNTASLSYTFVTKYKKLTTDIYTEMVSRKYFDESPEKTRGKYLGIGIATMVFGLLALILFSIILTVITGLLVIFTLGIALTSYGLMITLLSSSMPRKTEDGSKTLGEILGFKMYMETAERFRVQNLDPEDFEKYLSYAVVFGIEKQWAEKFKDIYKKTPDWLEAQGDLTDAIILSNLTNSFANSTTAKISSITQPTSSRGGSGWSGSFSSGGGFSGGGGGGGSVGGW